MATGTQIDVVMPQMGVSVSEGTITRWLKQPGEAIAQDEPLLEISTDKVDTEMPSPGEGVVAQILVGEGETVEVGTLLAVIAPAGAAVAEPAAAEPAPAAAAPEPATAGAGCSRGRAARRRQLRPGPPLPRATPGGNGRTFVSPVVARIAAEHGVDPGAVPGTGTGGRVTKKDILAYIESGAAAAPTAPAAPAPAAPVPAPPAPPVSAPAPARRAAASRTGRRTRCSGARPGRAAGAARCSRARSRRR